MIWSHETETVKLLTGKAAEESEMEILPEQVESPGDGHYID